MKKILYSLKEGEIKNSRKPILVIPLFICAIFFSQTIFAQSNEAKKNEIYSKLNCCACQVSFDKCVCSEAKEIKAYIDPLLENGATKEDIFFRVAKKYGINTIIDSQIRHAVEKRLINEAGKRRPQIALEPTSFNFGSISKKQGKISTIFKVHNKGNASLVITNIKVSCPCVTASLKVAKNKSSYFGINGAFPNWKETIRPGAFKKLEVSLSLNHPSMGTGKQMRAIFITSNDPVYPQTTLTVEAKVEE